jgi:amino acid adenylation domain-containing protein
MTVRRPYVHEMFCGQAASNKTAVAIETANASLSYGRLNEYSTWLANRLLAAGAVRGDPVGILTQDRTIYICSIIAALKAGCMFIPLPTDVPDKRLATLLLQADPFWIIADSASQSIPLRVMQGAAHKIREVMLVDSPLGNSQANGAVPNEVTVAGSDPDSICYLFFTSGSTGTPKGIAGRLRAIDHFIRWELDAFAIAAGTRVSQLISPTFDAVMRDIFVPLCSGGTICIPPDRETVFDGRALSNWLYEADIALIHCVPSLFRSFAEHWPASRRSSLKHILLAGERLFPSDVKTWLTRLGDHVQLVNLYGPSETTMTKFCYIVQPADQQRASVPIGKPIPGAMAFVFDESGQACPQGGVGEIYIRTPYRSLGYYKRPDLTRDAFVQNPFTNDPNDVLYRTGDLARILNDGNFEYLGRRDSQVKIRGIRVEPGEIESVLRQSGLIHDCAVTEKRDADGNERLCGYIVLRDGVPMSAIREFLSKELPDYMVPSALIPISTLPLTATGKVDRVALPEPGTEEIRRTLRGPTLIEEIICEIWARILGRQRIDPDDNFFHLGGHSLKVMQVIASIRKAFRVELPLMAMFETPTVRGLAAKVSRMKQLPDIPMIERTARGAGASVPLSYAQQRLWFLQQLVPASTAYNMSAAVRLSGALDKEAVRDSLNEIVRRHDVLRTSFPAKDGIPVQVIAPSFRVNVEESEISCATADLVESEGLRLAQEPQRPFDLSSEPALRVKIVRLAKQEHVLLLSMHHILADAWSMSIMIREFSQLYDARIKGEYAQLAPIEIQYGDFAAWQRRWLQGEVLAQQLSYWRGQLDGGRPLELPTDWARPATPSHRGARLEFSVPAELSRKLVELSRRENVTLFMTLLSAFMLVLARHSGQNDISIGTPIAGRRWTETENTVGCFVNTLVLRLSLDGNPSFQELLARVREVSLQAFAHQDLPFEKLVEDLQPERLLSRTPLFQVMFALQNAPTADLAMPSLRIFEIPVFAESTKFDLTVTMVDDESGLSGSVCYAADLFRAATIQRIVRHFEHVLGKIAAGPAIRISDALLPTEAELRTAIYEWNETGAEIPPCCVHELVEAQAALTPQAPAVEFMGQKLTYAELNTKANRWARHLQTVGVGREVRVGICLERSAEMVACVLAVLKAGGAFVPLDPASPSDRLRYTIENAKIRVLVTQRSLVEKLGCSPAMSLVIEDLEPKVDCYSSANLSLSVTRENLAYSLYTSGSTGRPKGVAVEHRQLVNYACGILGRLDTSHCSFAMVQPLTVDASFTALFPPLITGGCVHIIPQHWILDAAKMHEFLCQHPKAGLKIAPSHFAALHRSHESEGFMPSEVLVIGGEPSRWQWLRDLQRLAPDCTIVSQYGPTETTVAVLAYRLRQEDDQHGYLRTPLGTSLPNVQVYILDESMNPAPIGVPGEIYIGGESLARGYLDMPGLTAERFGPDPFARSHGGRLYRTGDRGRYLLDGNIDFLERSDGQVKVRGFRIELGEIESVMTDHPGIGEVAALISGSDGMDNQIELYVAPRRGVSLNVRELREHMSQKLPSYMMPATIVILEELPRLPHGKVDRKGLQELKHRLPQQQGSEPRTAEEQAIAAIWAGLLKRESVGIDENFFEIGGHSLLATQVVSRLQHVFGMDVPLLMIFEAPTVEALAKRLQDRRVELSTKDGEPRGAAIQRLYTDFEEVLAQVERLSDAEIQSQLAPLGNQA